MPPSLLASQPPDEASSTSSVPDTPARHWYVLARAAPVVGFGVAASTISVGGTVAAGVGLGRFSLEVVGASYGRTSEDVAQQTGVGGTFWPVDVGAAFCVAALDRDAVRSGGCAGLEYQRLAADGYGVMKPGSGAADWIAPSVSPFVELRLWRWVWAVSRLDVTVPTQHPTFVLENVGTVYQVAPLSARLSLGVELRF
jgi:hypothetical protein